MIKTSETGPRLTVPITEAEKELAKEAKKSFKLVLKELKTAISVITDLKDAIISQHPSKDDLKVKYRGRLLRYKKKITDSFNIFLTHLQENLELLGKINDPGMSRLREILVAEVSELSDGVEAFLDVLHDIEKDDFTKNLELISGQIEKRKNSIYDAIANQLFNHLDHDLLGKMRISNLRFNIMKRSRLLLMLSKSASDKYWVPDEDIGPEVKMVIEVKRAYNDGMLNSRKEVLDFVRKIYPFNERNYEQGGIISAILVLTNQIDPIDAFGSPGAYQGILTIWENV